MHTSSLVLYTVLAWLAAGLAAVVLLCVSEWYCGVDLTVTDVMVNSMFICLGLITWIGLVCYLLDTYGPIMMRRFDGQVLIKGRKRD